MSTSIIAFLSLHISCSFQSRSDDGNTLAGRMPLCSSSAFLNICLSPNLTHLLAELSTDGYVNTAQLILPILGMLVESFKGLAWLDLQSCEPIPLIFCLCQIVDTCWAAACASGSVEVILLKLQAVNVLRGLVTVTSKHRSNIPGIEC